MGLSRMLCRAAEGADVGVGAGVPNGTTSVTIESEAYADVLRTFPIPVIAFGDETIADGFTTATTVAWLKADEASGVRGISLRFTFGCGRLGAGGGVLGGK